jgi:hypothetical protein
MLFTSLDRDPAHELFDRALSLRRQWLQATSGFAVTEETSATGADLFIEGAPAGARVFLFRYELQSSVVQGGEARLVPCRSARETGAAGA